MRLASAAGTLILGKSANVVAVAGNITIGDGTGTDTLQTNAAGQISSTSALTFTAGGKQYVAFQGGLGQPAATNGPNDAKIDAPPIMFVFAVDGKAPMPKPVVAPPKPLPAAAPEQRQ